MTGACHTRVFHHRNELSEPIVRWVIEERTDGWVVRRVVSNPDLPIESEFLPRLEWTTDP